MAAWTVASRVASWAENWAVSKVDYLAASKTASRVESWAENWAASKVDYLAAQMVALKAVLTVDCLAA